MIDTFQNYTLVLDAQHCKYTKMHSVVHLKRVNFMIGPIYLNKLFCKKKYIYIIGKKYFLDKSMYVKKLDK